MNKALFLDRDGVINKEISYLHRIEDVEFIDGIFEMCRFFEEGGFLPIIVTNQAGIARGYYSEGDFHVLNDWMLKEFRQKNIHIRKVYFCPYHPTDGVGRYKKDSPDRKPRPGMLLRAQQEFNLNMTKSILLGDKESDIQAGIDAGVGTNVLFSSQDNVSTAADIVIDRLAGLPDLITNK